MVAKSKEDLVDCDENNSFLDEYESEDSFDSMEAQRQYNIAKQKCENEEKKYLKLLDECNALKAEYEEQTKIVERMKKEQGEIRKRNELLMLSFNMIKNSVANDVTAMIAICDQSIALCDDDNDPALVLERPYKEGRKNIEIPSIIIEEQEITDDEIEY